MEIFNSLYDFFGLELISESATLVDLVNNLLQVGLALFIVCFFIKSLFALMLNTFSCNFLDD